jgi:DNA-binding MarR family transcriptional regulator
MECIWQDGGVPDLPRLFDDLVRVEILLWDAVDRRLRRDLDLPLGRFEALRAVSGSSTSRVQDVAGALAITVGAASKLVDRLETSGLCARRAHPTDRRSSLVTLTDAGRDVLAAATAAVDDELGHRLDAPELDAHRLAELLAHLRAHLSG